MLLDTGLSVKLYLACQQQVAPQKTPPATPVTYPQVPLQTSLADTLTKKT